MSETPVPALPAATEVYLLQGVAPEIAAYAMAKYSRSALSMRESLQSLDGQKAEKFLNTFYFQYGHRSIADLAHLSFAIERLSILAAIDVADEPRWDGQERSTRYQAFRKSGYVTPPELVASADETARTKFAAAVEALFSAYEALSERVAALLAVRHPRPEAMKPEAYQRTLRARAFDASRYLLPLATATSLGQIVSARTLEAQIVRLLSSPRAESRAVGEALKRAASDPGAVPTLVKYTDPSSYQTQTRSELAQAAAELLAGIEPERGPRVSLAEPESLEVEIAATLLYPHCHHAYRQILEAVAALDAARRDELTAMGTAHRGAHDELLRPYQAGQPLQFDLLLDIGGYRDLHRHRRCVQFRQPFTGAHGYEIPRELEPPDASGEAAFYRSAMDRAMAAATPAEASAYALPLGARVRSLFKMDFAEAVYITELRTGVGGNASYRTAAWAMYEALARRHPALARGLRVTPPGAADPLQR